MKLITYLGIFILIFSTVSFSDNLDAINVTLSWSNKWKGNWEEKIFDKKTEYTSATLNDRAVLRASSHASASGLVRQEKVDLLATPYLNWSWLTESRLSDLDETTKSGDDYVARVYVVIDGGMMMWRTRSINYVWSSNQEESSLWDNAYAGDKVKMVAVQGKDATLNHWYQEKRNVYKDLIAMFGDKGSPEKNAKAYRYIDAIAVMTDTDNSSRQAVTYYGNLSFTRE